ncbi:MAG: hypothetical protein HQ539_00445 [Parcubacteria group bacterium]|nr:hypothetical protein [Parcubacteria group bacterium]
MDTITVSKKEYQNLVERALRYDYLARIIQKKGSIFSSPPTSDVKEVVESFRATKLYNTPFLRSLEKGLNRSSYFKTEQK